MGRRSKLTPEARERFILALKSGAFLEVAARHAGWSAASMYRYLRDDAPANDGFRDEVERALIELELRVAGTLTRAALKNPRWALVFLERRFPQRWARSARPEGESEAATSAAVVVEKPVVLDPALLDAIVPRLLDAAAHLRAGAPPPSADALARFEERGDDTTEREP